MTRWAIFGVLFLALSVGTALGLNAPSLIGREPDPLIPAEFLRPIPPPPRLLIVGPSRHDFGQVARMSQVATDFTIGNEGPSDLIIQRGRTACFTYVQIPAAATEEGPLTLKPGETTDIHVTWAIREPVTRRVTGEAFLQTNDPLRPEVRFEVEGTAEPAPRD